MKAIETEYKGYKFRSRLEAKWAVFFDACGVYWEYEPEGYDFGNGLYYLPDFLLHDVIIQNNNRTSKESYTVDLYAEIKGKITKKDAQKILYFAGVHSENYSCDKITGDGGYIFEYPIIILPNIPFGNNIKSIDRQIEDNLWNIYKSFYQYDIYPFDFKHIDNDNWTAYPCINKQGKFSILGVHDLYNRDDIATEKAYKKAIQARFEHFSK